MRAGLLLPAALTLGACGPPVPGPRPAAPAAIEAAEGDLGTLLLLADRRMFEPFSVRRLSEGPEAVRGELALVLGRIGDPAGVPTLDALLQDPSPAVRRRAAFALGFIEGAEATPTLLAASGDADPETGRRAIESLGRLAAPLATVEAALQALPAPEGRARLLPALYRFDAAELVPLAKEALGSGDPELERWAAYALARKPLPESRPELRALLDHADPWLRGWGARALGRVGEAEDAAPLAALLADPDPGPVVQALGALTALAAAGRALPPARSAEQLLTLIADPRPAVRVSALAAAPAWWSREVREAVIERFTSGSPWEREAALLALASAEEAHALDFVLAAAADPDPALRASAVEAAVLADSLAEVSRVLAEDRHPAVRGTLLSARLEGGEMESAVAHAAEALEDPDPGLRAAALAWLVEHPELPGEAISRAMEGPGADRLVDVRVAGVEALAARALAVPAEREALVDRLIACAEHREWLVRRAAARALEDLGMGRLAIGTVETGWAIASYREAAQRTRRDRWIDLETRHGVLRLRLDCSTAPLSCLNFANLVAQGFYDGLAFHRVVPDFVVQAGDPRGDGAGGPGFTIRDEYNLERYERGTVGMALAGPDTGGSQFFITLSRQPHLDGTYTAFGRVVAGEDLLDRIEEGDRILRMTEGAEDLQGARPGGAL